MGAHVIVGRLLNGNRSRGLPPRVRHSGSTARLLRRTQTLSKLLQIVVTSGEKLLSRRAYLSDDLVRPGFFVASETWHNSACHQLIGCAKDRRFEAVVTANDRGFEIDALNHDGSLAQFRTIFLIPSPAFTRQVCAFGAAQHRLLDVTLLTICQPTLTQDP